MSELELAYAECLDLLATDTVGRVAFTTPQGPRIVPVNYALEGAALEFRTTANSELAVYAPDHRSPSRSIISTGSGGEAGASWHMAPVPVWTSRRPHSPRESPGPADAGRCDSGSSGPSSPAAGSAAVTGHIPS